MQMRTRILLVTLVILSVMAGMQKMPVAAAATITCSTWANGSLRTTRHLQVDAESRHGTQYTQDLATSNTTSAGYDVDFYLNSETETSAPTVEQLPSSNCTDWVATAQSYGQTCTSANTAINEETGYQWTNLGASTPYGPVTDEISNDGTTHVWREYSGTRNVSQANKVATQGTSILWTCIDGSGGGSTGGTTTQSSAQSQPVTTDTTTATQPQSYTVAPAYADNVTFNKPDSNLVYQTGIVLSVTDNSVWRQFLHSGDPAAFTNGGLTPMYSVTGAFGTTGYFNSTIPDNVVYTMRFVVVAASGTGSGQQQVVAVYEERVLKDGSHQTIWYYNTGAVGLH